MSTLKHADEEEGKKHFQLISELWYVQKDRHIKHWKNDKLLNDLTRMISILYKENLPQQSGVLCSDHN